MDLKAIQLVGFKSFADKTLIQFDAGVTCIVGPNGCGKSNVSDAIRWVLGEQSAKTLRGAKMEDVIFNGTQKRRPLGMAEVTLSFDNSDHALPVDYAEVGVTRRVYRNGESEYAINGKTCRLKDVLELFRDTGIGIPEEDHDRIFERFYRVDKARSQSIGGTGLGLSIVKHGAIFHNAQLELDSTPGVGTAITLRFPL